MKNIYVGIDLGTTFSAIAYLDEGGIPTIIDNPDAKRGDNITPSCVEFQKDQVVIGKQARAKLQLRGKAFGRFKRDMGSPIVYDRDGVSITPTELSAHVLKEMHSIGETVGNVAKAVVTVPANFTSDARESTLAAAKNAGLSIEHIINEPTAAAIYYAYVNGEELNGHYVVFDLGGGTFDVTILKAQGREFEVLVSNGIQELGGTDFDNALITLVSKKFKNQTGEDLDDLGYTFNQAEADKISLSTRSRIVAGGDSEIGDGSTTIEVKRHEFEQEIAPLLALIEMMCEDILAEARLKPNDIKEIILAGGSTRMPGVKDIVKRVFGKSPNNTENVDEMVALGAAIWAGLRSDQAHLSAVQKQSLTGITVSEISNHYFGTLVMTEEADARLVRGESMDGLAQTDRVEIIIPKGSKLPCKKVENLTNPHDNQTTFNLWITQSSNEEKNPEFVKILWNDTLGPIKPRPRNETSLEVEYSYDLNGIMHCRFTDISPDSNRETIEVDLDLAKGDTGMIALEPPKK